MISINIYEILMQMVNFLILLFLLNKFLINPLSEFIENRSSGIQSNIDDAFRNKEESESLLIEQKEMLNSARKEAKSIRDKSVEITKSEKQQILNTAKKESESLMTKTKKDIELAIKKAKKDLINELGQLSVTLAESVLKRKIDHKDKEAIIDEGVNKISVS